MTAKNPLQKQLELEKFLHTAEYVKNTSQGLKKLTSTELAYINQHCSSATEANWRLSPVKVEIPGHVTVDFSVLTNPLARARDILGQAQQLAAEEGPWIGAQFAYVQLVLEHLFNEGNRRTAALAAFWILCADHVSVNPLHLVTFTVGNLREPKALKDFEENLSRLKIN
jgi:hypothetical protein